MRRLTFKEYYLKRSLTESAEPVFAKSIELNKPDMHVFIDIALTDYEQHPEAIAFLRRVADELELLSSMNCKRFIKTEQY